MLKQPAPFPFPGSEALYGDRRVRIISVQADGRRLITGIGKPALTRTVELADLVDAAISDDPVKAWHDARVEQGGLSAFVDLYDDFARFAALCGVEHADLPTGLAFGRRLHELTGAVATRRRLPNRVAADRCMPLSLKAQAMAA